MGSSSPAAAPEVVQTDGGPVTLCDLAVLKNDLTQLDTEAAALKDKSDSLSSLARSKLIECGRALLVAYRNVAPPAALQPLIQAATPLATQADNQAAEIRAVHETPHHGLGVVLAKATDWNRERKASTELAATLSQLEPILIEIARQAVDFPDAGSAAVHAQAVAAEQEASDAATELTSVTASANAARDEVGRRDQAVRDLGFDAPYTAAYLATYGTPTVQSPLLLKRGEQAVLSVPATLARRRTRTQYVGGSSGFSFPIGHTGIRYRVGSYHGQPIEQEFMANVDTGQLVVTNQRVAFVGAARSMSVPLAKLLHVECYNDGIAIFKEGRENADFFLVGQPQYALFLINWELSRTS